jgi:CheY-like chemotaxis protein
MADLEPLALVVHERRGVWVRQLRPRLGSWPVRWYETRSASDLRKALQGLACPLIVIDLSRRVRAGLEELHLASQAAPGALILVLDPDQHDAVPLLARELGATHVISGPVVPPALVALLERWLTLARRRTMGNGWSRSPEPESEPAPWAWLTPLLAGTPVPRARPRNTPAAPR